MFSQSTPSGERGVVALFSGLCQLDHLGQWAHGRMIGIFYAFSQTISVS